MSDWNSVRAGEIATQRKEAVVLETGAEYRTMGVRWYGRGAYDRGVATTETVKAKSLFRAREDDFVFNRIDTQKGAFDVVPAGMDGALATNEFPLYEIDRERCLPAFLLLYFQQQRVLDQIAESRAGSEGRARWKEADFESWVVPLPSIPEQRRIVDLIRKIDAHIEALETEHAALRRTLVSLRESAFSDAPTQPLSDLCSIEAKLVDPTLDNNADLPHIGVDVIEKDSGRLLEPRTARQDGVTSGKYLCGPGDVIYSKIRPALRKVALPTERSLCSADAYPLRPAPGVPAALLREALLVERVADQAIARSGRTKMPKINRKELFSIQVPFPSAGKRGEADVLLSGVRDASEALNREIEAARELRAVVLAAVLSEQHVVPPTYEDEIAA